MFTKNLPIKVRSLFYDGIFTQLTKFTFIFLILCFFLRSDARAQTTVEQQWVKSFGGGSEDLFLSLVTTNDGGYLVAGQSKSTNAGFTNQGGFDAIIVKYDSADNQEWVKNFGGSGNDYFTYIVKANDGGYLAAGISSSTNAGFTNQGGFDAIIVKYDSNYVQQWVKNFGGGNIDAFKFLNATNDGGYLAVGYSYSTNASFVNKGSSDAIIIKYDSAGNQEWAKNFGGGSDDYFFASISNSENGYLAVGYSYSTNAGFTNKGGIDAVLVKYDSAGNQQWVKNFGGSGSDDFYSLINTGDGGYLASGDSSSTNAGFTNKGGIDAVLVKYDSAGNQQWVKNFGGGGSDHFFSPINTSDGGYLVTGNSGSTNAGFTNKGGIDTILVKYDSAGNQQWVKNFGGGSDDGSACLIANSSGDYLLVGDSRSTNAGFTNKGMNDGVLIKYKTYLLSAYPQAQLDYQVPNSQLPFNIKELSPKDQETSISGQLIANKETKTYNLSLELKDGNTLIKTYTLNNFQVPANNTKTFNFTIPTIDFNPSVSNFTFQGPHVLKITDTSNNLTTTLNWNLTFSFPAYNILHQINGGNYIRVYR